MSQINHQEIKSKCLDLIEKMDKAITNISSLQKDICKYGISLAREAQSNPELQPLVEKYRDFLTGISNYMLEASIIDRTTSNHMHSID